MSFITDIITYGLGQLGIDYNPNAGTINQQNSIAQYTNQRVGANLKKSNTTERDNTTEIEIELDLEADTGATIPVVYGDAFLTGHLVDAVLTNNNCTMWYAIALCEATGNTIDGTPSEIEFHDIYRNGNKLTFFDSTGGVDAIAEWEGEPPNLTANYSVQNRLKIYCYSNGSESPAGIVGQTTAQHGNAYDIFPGWTSTDQMSGLAFVLVRLDYSAVDDLTELGKLTFNVRNTMTDPGDVLYDYMTNTRYGAGIPTEEIDV